MLAEGSLQDLVFRRQSSWRRITGKWRQRPILRGSWLTEREGEARQYWILLAEEDSPKAGVLGSGEDTENEVTAELFKRDNVRAV